MLTTLLMFIAAVSLSGVAGYYSVIGLTTIFSSAFIPVLIMAGTLETSKVIVASWLYNNWTKTPWLLKSYLTGAVVVLMFITSLGIFGFLSKAHVEQAAAGAEQQAKVLHITQSIDQQNAIIERAKQNLANAGKGNEATNAAINSRIDDANRVIDSANKRVQPQIDEQQKIIDAANAKIELRARSTQSQIDDIDRQVANLDNIVKSLIDQKKTSQAQARQQEQQADRTRLAKQKTELLKQIDAMRQATDPQVNAAKVEITRLRAKVDDEIKQARSVIDQLTTKLSQGSDTDKLQADIDAEKDKIKAAEAQIETLNADKFKLETEGRKLEAETGPIKYIAQALYGDSIDQNILEHAVRWIIVLIIVVFDPLAVLMLIAANQGLREWREYKPSEPDTVIETIPDAVPEYPAAEPEANGPQTVTLNIEGKDELIAAVQGLRDEMAALNAAIAAPSAEPVSTPDLANLSGVAYSEETVPEPVTVVPQNHTFSYTADVGIVTIATDGNVQIIETISDDQISFDFDAEPEVLVKPPIAEDDIAEEDLARLAQLPTEPEAQEANPEPTEDAERQWQIIDQLPEVKTSEDGTKTVHEFMDELRDRHRQRIDRHTNTNTDN
jgi:hypothetical protein